MKRIKRVLAVYMMIACMVQFMPGFNGLFPWGPQVASGATSFTLYAASSVSDLQGSLGLSWGNVSSASSYLLSYYSQSGDLQTQTVTGATYLVGNTYQLTVSNLTPDFIYDFKVSALDGTGTEIKSAEKKALTYITAEVKGFSSDPVSRATGGKLAGYEPKLDFAWKIPKEAKTVRVLVSHVNPVSGATIVDKCQTDYADSMDIDYNIYLGTDLAASNRGIYKVRYSTTAGAYIATTLIQGQVSTVANSVYLGLPNTLNGWMEFSAAGLDTTTSTTAAVNKWGTPTNSYPDGTVPHGFDPGNSADLTSPTPDLHTVYRTQDIVAGSYYNALVKPVLGSDTSSNKNFCGDRIASTNTPVKFDLQRESNGNIIATIYQVENGIEYIMERNRDDNFSVSSDLSVGKQFAEAIRDGKLSIFIEDNGSNLNFFRAVVKTNQSKSLYSDIVEYIPSQDIPKAPLPEELTVSNVQLVSGGVVNRVAPSLPAGNYKISTSKVTLLWKKPYNYATLSSKNEVYYHVMLSSSQFAKPALTTDRTGIGTELLEFKMGDNTVTKSYDIVYREVAVVDLRACTLLDKNFNATTDPNTGVYLQYVIDLPKQGENVGQLFYEVSMNSGSPVKTPLTNQEYSDASAYPDFFLSNKTYFIKMYSQKIGTPSSKSDYSLAAGFTTPLESKRKPPLPTVFEAPESKNIFNKTTSKNYFTINWNKLENSVLQTVTTSVYDRLYYDLYASDKEHGPYFRMASTETMGPEIFEGLEESSSVISLTMGDLSKFGNATVNALGNWLLPNKAYYFRLQTRMVNSSTLEANPSDFSQILALTTKRNDIVINPAEEYPKSPVDFAISKDADNNNLVTSNSVTLQWSGSETDVSYTLVRTPKSISSNALVSVVEADTANNREYFKDVNTSNWQSTAGLIYNSTTGIFTFTAGGLYPNSLYYFNLIAHRTGADADKLWSKWAPVAVATTLIEAPDSASFTVVDGYEIGFSWDDSSFFDPENYSIALAKAGSGSYTTLPVGRYTISESALSGNTSRFYARITSLEKNTTYSVQVTGNKYNAQNVLKTTNPALNAGAVMSTRDTFHEIDARWKARDGYSFEIEIKTDDALEYTVLTQGSGFTMTSIEKTKQLAGTGYSYYYARIPSLKANTKYDIKVRGVKAADNTGTTSTKSLRVGPVSTRTDFSQSDYDNVVVKDKEKSVYDDSVKRHKDKLYWVLQSQQDTFAIKLKGDLSINYINNNNSTAFTIDFSENGIRIARDNTVYIPLSVLELLKTKNRNLVMKASTSEYILTPGSIDVNNYTKIKDLKDISGVKDIYAKISIFGYSSPRNSIPGNLELVSDVKKLEVSFLGSEKTDTEVENDMANTLQNYVDEGFTNLRNASVNEKDTAEKLKSYIDRILSVVDDRMTDYAYNLFKNNGSVLTGDSVALDKFNKNITIRTTFDTGTKGAKAAYAYWNGQWNKMPASISGNLLSFATTAVGEHAVMAASSVYLAVIPSGHWAAEDIEKFGSKYDLREIFGEDMYSGIEKPVSISGILTLLDKVAYSGQLSSSGFEERIKALGLEPLVSLNSRSRLLTRQEMAVAVMKLYEKKTGLTASSLRPNRRVIPSDERDIKSSYYNYVQFCLDKEYVTLYQDNSFKPQTPATRAQVISVFARILKALGEL